MYDCGQTQLDKIAVITRYSNKIDSISYFYVAYEWVFRFFVEIETDVANNQVSQITLNLK